MISKFLNKKLFTYHEDRSVIMVNNVNNQVFRKKFKIGVIIDTAISIPPTTGVTWRLYHLSKTLSLLGHKQVWFICNRNFLDKKTLEELKNPYIKIYLLTPKLFYNVSFLNSLIKKEHVDILQYEITQTFIRLGLALKKINKIPTVLEIHDVEAFLRETLNRKQEIDFMDFLQFVASYYTEAVITMTPVDRKLLIEKIKVPNYKLFIAPNGIDNIFPYNGINKRENILLFLGNIFYPPNQQAVIFLIENVLPIIKKNIKDIKLKVIGMVPKKIKLKYKKISSIIFTDEIKDENLFNKELSSSTIGLCTVLSGSGMKVKILSYGASGLPIVTTPLGLSGYEKIKSLIIVEPEANSIANAIVNLLKNKNRAVKLGKENRRLILREFNWIKIAKGIIKVYNFVYNIGKSPRGKKIKIPKPFWFEEGRHYEKVSPNCYLIKEDKILKIIKK